MRGSTSTVLRTEVRLFMREPGSLFWIIAFPPLLLGLLGLIPDMRQAGEGLGGASVLTLYVPVSVILAMIFAGISAMPVVVATYREQRVLRRMATTPAKASDLLLAQYVIHGAAAVLGGLLAVILARVAYDIALPGNVWGWLFVFVLVLMTCMAIGGVIASAASTGKIATTVGTVMIFPLMFTAGVWLPVAAMPGLLGDVVAWTPLGAAALAFDAAGAGDWPPLRHVLVVLGWTVALATAAVRLFKWE